jgi:hypothetical protein
MSNSEIRLELTTQINLRQECLEMALAAKAAGDQEGFFRLCAEMRKMTELIILLTAELPDRILYV